MKKFKKFISLVLSCAIVLSLCIPAFAAETDPVFTGPYADLKTSIYRQLKAQNKLDHFELQLAALLPQEASTQSTSRTTRNWNAPNGGLLTYTYDWTYRGETGYVQSCTTYMNKAYTTAYMDGFGDDFGDLIEKVIKIKKALQGKVLDHIEAAILIAQLIQPAERFFSRNAIADANGYGKVSVVYDSISGGTSTVAYGWDTYPLVKLDWPDAYDVSFKFA